jgi:hypothetical protein
VARRIRHFVHGPVIPPRSCDWWVHKVEPLVPFGAPVSQVKVRSLPERCTKMTCIGGPAAGSGWGCWCGYDAPAGRPPQLRRVIIGCVSIRVWGARARAPSGA